MFHVGRYKAFHEISVLSFLNSFLFILFFASLVIDIGHNDLQGVLVFLVLVF